MRRRDLLAAAALSSFGTVTARASLPAPAAVHDLVIVGTGIAGLSAAVAAAQSGVKDILLLEKSTTLGGHSILSSGYVTAVIRDPNHPERGEKAVSEMIRAMNFCGAGRGKPELVRKLAEESGNAVNWLSSLGLTWKSEVFQSLAGIAPRSYISSNVRAGYDYVITLNTTARRLGARTRFGTRAMSLARNPRTDLFEIGVLQGNAERGLVQTRAVALATGGFTGNVAMRRKYVPFLDESFPTTADPWGEGTDTSTGDGILLGEEAGAALVDMDCIQVIPYWGGRLTDYVGADIYVDGSGKRFVNEASNWKTIGSAIFRLPGKTCWVITDSVSQQGASRSIKIMNGIVRTADSIEEMARGMNVSPETLRATIDRYNGFVRAGKDEDFGKTMFTQEIKTPPFYYGAEKLYAHYCCGGLAIDRHASVLDTTGTPIPGLFAAGEVTGGIHGEDRLGGSSITDCLVFGRTAGNSVRRYLAAL